MTDFIIKKYLSDGGSRGRKHVGVILGFMGIGFNLLLFLLKVTAGTLSGSVAITADGFNNLADSCSCILAVLGFRLGAKKPSQSFPMGYGRLEYLSGLLISAVILFIGMRMVLSSIGKILDPEPIDGCPAVIVILIISILVKGYMYRYNSRIGRMIQSSGMRAAALDSLCDCIATLAILTAILIERFTGFNADGYTGILVALCILYAGITSVIESTAPLLGKGLDADSKRILDAIIDTYPAIGKAENVMLHDYGPERKLLTFAIDTDDPNRIIPQLRADINSRLHMDTVISPVSNENHDLPNKSALTDQQYHQKKEIQERESIER